MDTPNQPDGASSGDWDFFVKFNARTTSAPAPATPGVLTCRIETSLADFPVDLTTVDVYEDEIDNMVLGGVLTSPDGFPTANVPLTCDPGPGTTFQITNVVMTATKVTLAP